MTRMTSHMDGAKAEKEEEVPAAAAADAAAAEPVPGGVASTDNHPFVPREISMDEAKSMKLGELKSAIKSIGVEDLAVGTDSID